MKLIIALLFLLPAFSFAGEKNKLTGLADDDFIHARAVTQIEGRLEKDTWFHTLNLEVMLIFTSKDNGQLAAHDYIAFDLEPKSVTTSPSQGTFVEHDLMLSGELLNASAEKVVALARDYGYTNEEQVRVTLITALIGAAPFMLKITTDGSDHREFIQYAGSTKFTMKYDFVYVPAEDYLSYVDYCHSPKACAVLR